MGLQASKGAEGIEGNFQIAFATTKRKRYERVDHHHHLPRKPKLPWSLLRTPWNLLKVTLKNFKITLRKQGDQDHLGGKEKG